MASANPQPTSSFLRLARCPSKDHGLRSMEQVFVALLAAALAPWLYTRLHANFQANILFLLPALAGALWYLHLRVAGGGGRVISAVLVAPSIAYCELYLSQNTHLRALDLLAALGCGVFVYATIWVLSVHSELPGLQTVATAAAILTIGTIAKPALLLACVFLCLIIFSSRIRRDCGLVHFALLLFTPVIMCEMALIGLTFLYSGKMVSLGHYRITIATTGSLFPPLLPWAIWPAIFVAAVLLTRGIERAWGTADLALGYFIVMLPFLQKVQWSSDPISWLDIVSVILCGSASLIAVSRPLHRLESKVDARQDDAGLCALSIAGLSNNLSGIENRTETTR